MWVIFALLDPDSDSGSGSTGPIESGSRSGSETLALANSNFSFHLNFVIIVTKSLGVDPGADPADPDSFNMDSKSKHWLAV